MTNSEYTNPADRTGFLLVRYWLSWSLCWLLTVWVSTVGAQERAGISDAAVAEPAARAWRPGA